MLSYLAKKSPRITEERHYLHSLLSKKKMQPLSIWEKGSNLTGLPSYVRINHNHYQVEYSIDKSLLESDDIIRDIWERESEKVLNRYPDIKDIDRDVSIAPADFQITPINMDSLENRLRSLLDAFDPDISIEKANLRELLSAYQVAILAYHFNGHLVNRWEKKPYGRVYQLGIGVQNLPKTLRPVILNPAHEYDIGSSVFSWRLSMAIKLGLVENNPSSIKARFPATYEYTTNTKQVRKGIVTDIAQNPDVIDSVDEILSMVKRAITALSNGAKINQGYYFDSKGRYHQPAIREILQNDNVLVSAFQNNQTISAITEESAVIANSIKDYWKSGGKDNWSSHPDDLYYKNGAIAKPRLLTFLYQHFETALMDRFCSLLAEKTNNQVLARIHDAVVVREKIPKRTLATIIQELKREFDLPVLRIDGNAL